MNTLERTITALENKKKETVLLLEKSEVALGNQLLTAGASAADSEDVSLFNANAGNRKKLLRDISEIERLVARMKVARENTIESGKCAGELAALEKERYEVFGKLLYQYSSVFMPSIFETYYIEAKSFYDQADELLKKTDALQSEMEKSPFLARFITQMKLSSVKIALSSLQRKASASTAKGAAAVVIEGMSVFGDNEIPETVKTAFDSCVSLQADIQKQKQLHDANMEEEASIKATLLTLGVVDFTGKKKIAQIKTEIDKLEAVQAQLCRKTGHAYADLYCTKDGESIVECTGLGADKVLIIQTERVNLFSYNRRLDIIQLSTTLEEADRRIEALKRDAASIRRQITLLEENSIAIEEKIAAASATRDMVVGKRAVLENEEVLAVKRLKEKNESDTDSACVENAE